MRTAALFFAFLLSLQLQPRAIAADNGADNGDTTKICKETAAGADLTMTKTVAEFKLRPDCWTGWVIIPTNADSYQMGYVGGGVVNCLFPDGTVISFSANSDRKVEEKMELFSVKVYNHKKFKMAGRGKVMIKVIIEKKGSKYKPLSSKAKPPLQVSPKRPKEAGFF